MHLRYNNPDALEEKATKLQRVYLDQTPFY